MSASTPDTAIAYSEAVDAIVADPRSRDVIIAGFSAWLENRAKVSDCGFNSAGEDLRYLVAKLAPWHDLVSEEDGHGPWQVYGSVDRALLTMFRAMVGMRPSQPDTHFAPRKKPRNTNRGERK